MVLEFIFFMALLCGCVGVYLGSLVDRGFAGFWLGFFLGPIGLIIVFLLPKEHKMVPKAPPPEDANLDNDEYKVWLIDSYGIQKNEILSQYLCLGKLFDSVDLALIFAHSAEIKSRQLAKETKTKNAVASSKANAYINKGSFVILSIFFTIVCLLFFATPWLKELAS